MIVTAFKSTNRVITHGLVTPATTALAIEASFAGVGAAGTFLSQGFTWPIYVIVALSAAVCRGYAVIEEREPGPKLARRPTGPRA
jgi:hypothetical protein